MSGNAQEEVTREWDAMAGEWDDMASGYRDEFIKILWQETGYSSDEDRKRLVVLDFGCGTGLLTEKVQSQVAHVISIDVAPSMIKVLQEKIKSGGWNNVEVYCAVAAHVGQAAPEIKAALEAWKVKVDIVACSSVLSFVPEGDLKATMIFLGHMLKPGTGMLIHSDWSKGEDQPDGFTKEKALAMYGMGGLQAKATKTITMKTGGYEMPVFVGVATKSA